MEYSNILKIYIWDSWCIGKIKRYFLGNTNVAKQTAIIFLIPKKFQNAIIVYNKL